MIDQTTAAGAVPPFFILAACGAAALAFWLAGAPAPWLIGSALAGAVAALLGAPPKIHAQVLDAALVILGISLGASMGPQSLSIIWHWPASLVSLLVTIPVIIGTAQTLLMRLFDWEAKEAFLASVPGALSYALAIAAAENLDVRKIAIAQSMRLLGIVVLVPLVFAPTAGLRPADIVVAPPTASLLALAALVIAAVASGIALKRVNVPAAPMIGAMIVSCLCHAGGWVTGAVPLWLFAPAIVAIGANVGSRFGGSEWRSLVGMLAPSAVCVGATFVTAALAAVATAWLFKLPTLQTLLAFAPGGLDSIAVLVLALKLDAAFVTVHQLVRFMGIAALLPFVFRWLSATAPQAQR